MALTPWGTLGHVPPTFTNGWARGHREWKNSKQETDQTVLTITKALTETTYCAFRAKKWRGTTEKNFSGASVRCPPLSLRIGPPLSNSFRRHCRDVIYNHNHNHKHNKHICKAPYHRTTKTADYLKFR